MGFAKFLFGEFAVAMAAATALALGSVPTTSSSLSLQSAPCTSTPSPRLCVAAFPCRNNLSYGLAMRAGVRASLLQSADVQELGRPWQQQSPVFSRKAARGSPFLRTGE